MHLECFDNITGFTIHFLGYGDFIAIFFQCLL